MTTGERSVHVCGMSRSGTTLVTTMLDAHPSVSMGYELMPADLPSVSDLLRAVRDARSATDGSARRVGNHLKDAGFPSAGVFVKRAARACVEPDAFVEMLESLRDAGVTALDGMAERRLISREVVRRKMRVEGTSIGGHKIGADLAGPMLRDEPDAVIVFVIRDPRDVAASQQSRGFTNDIRSIARSWNRLADQTLSLSASHPRRAGIVRYETLAAAPEDTMRPIMAMLGLGVDPAMLDLASSKASVLSSSVRHANADNLQQPIFLSSIGRAAEELSSTDFGRLSRLCGRRLEAFGYARDRAGRVAT